MSSINSAAPMASRVALMRTTSLLERQTTGLQFDGPIACSDKLSQLLGDKLSQLLGAGCQRGVFDGIAARGICKDLPAGAAEGLGQGILAALPLISHRAVSMLPSVAMICGRWPRGNGGRSSCPRIHPGRGEVSTKSFSHTL